MPGFSRSGIQRKSTAMLTRNVAAPMVISNRCAIPSARTVHGATPQCALIITASPSPKRNSPVIRKADVVGSGVIVNVSLELHHVTGTSFPSFDSNASFMDHQSNIFSYF